MFRKHFVLYILVILFLPIFAFAHGGVEKHADATLVFLKQSPLSPLAGELVTLSFAFSNINSGLPLKNLPVALTLTDTYLGDESKDVKVLSQDFTTDVNGDITWQYTFPKENYYDIDLDFKDPKTRVDEEVGFLVQPRIAQITTSSSSLPLEKNIVSVLVGIVIGSFGSKFLLNRK